jgi:dTDP-4-dehydrorhamnose reductase
MAKILLKTILNFASFKEPLNIVGDQWGRPTSVRDIARVILEIVNQIKYTPFYNWGIYHYAGEEH